MPGIGPKKLDVIRASVVAWDDERTTSSFARGLGLSHSEAHMLWELHGEKVEEKVRADPYDTLRPLPSLSWGTVDSIARYSLSLPPDHLVRARAALLEAFAKASQSGHTARAKLNLVRDTALLLQTGEFRARDAQKPAEAALAKAESEGVVVNYPPPGDADALFDVVRGDEKRRAKLVTPKPATNRTSAVHRGDDRYQLGRVYKDEIAIANAVRWRTPRPHDASEGAEEAAASRQQQADDAAAAAAEVELDLEDGIELSEEQRLAVAKAQSGRLLVLTGGPGTGKTYAVRQIVREWRRRNKKVVLACPTARAASVLSEAVGQSASTIHRLLEYNPQEERYKRDQNNQLDADALVIDEASMLDLKLAARLLEATPETCSLLFVGDKDQLPSVGAGAVLHDLLRSPRVPRVELETVFRLESDAGAIALNAQRINSGVVPLKLERGQALKEKLKGEKRPAGCVFIPRKTEATAAQMIGQRTNGVLGWLEAVGYDLRTEVQVLSPIKGGPAGTKSLNRMLQLTLNPRAAAAAATATNGGPPPPTPPTPPPPASPARRSRPPAAPPTARRRASSACGSATPWYSSQTTTRRRCSTATSAASSASSARVGAAVPGGVRDRRRHRRRRRDGRREGQRRASAGGRLLEGEPRQGCGALVRDDGAQRDASRTQGGASPNHRGPAPLTPLLPPLQVHKAQGSEYPVVVLPVLPQHGAMLYRNLLYTAVSRARRLLVLVGDERAIETAVGEDKMQRRETLLAHRISDDRFASAATKHL